MPLYEYSCDQCGGEFETLVKSSRGRDSVACPSCGSRKTARKLSVFGVGAESARSSAPPTCANCPTPGGACPYR